jgi:hypothetical protein
VLSKVTASEPREPRADEGGSAVASAKAERTGPTAPLLLTGRRIDSGESH